MEMLIGNLFGTRTKKTLFNFIDSSCLSIYYLSIDLFCLVSYGGECSGSMLDFPLRQATPRDNLRAQETEATNSHLSIYLFILPSSSTFHLCTLVQKSSVYLFIYLPFNFILWLILFICPSSSVLSIYLFIITSSSSYLPT